MDIRDLRSILDRIRGVRYPCDLDTLLFFYRHPRALLTNEQLVAFLGYDRGQVAKSLDQLIEAGLVTRSQNPTHAARLYVLEFGHVPDGLLASLLEAASTRQGRRQVMELLAPAPEQSPAQSLRRSATIAKIA